VQIYVKSHVLMPVDSGLTTLDRTRLCELAEIERTRHLRWTKVGLLSERDVYGELDLVRVMALAQLVRALKPKLARAVWSQIRDEINGFDCERLEVVVLPATDKAWLVRTPGELDEALPRDTAVFVVSLAAEIAEARKRLHDFRAIERQDTPEASEPIPLRLASEA
jgi:hypothetical protein